MLCPIAVEFGVQCVWSARLAESAFGEGQPMPAKENGSVSRWLGGLRAGGDESAQRIWERYFKRLVVVARDCLGRSPRAAENEEDVALSAFDSFCAAAARGRLPRLDDRGDLWRVLVTITARKSADQAKRQRRLKRGGGRVVTETDLYKGDDGGLDFLAGAEPTPEFAAMVAEEYRRRLQVLPGEAYRRVAGMRMEGYTNEEIAEQLGIGLRSVVRKLEIIRRAWLEEDAS
jgi:DNA-directed RNA polymerase specialized sigma24 family protein